MQLHYNCISVLDVPFMPHQMDGNLFYFQKLFLVCLKTNNKLNLSGFKESVKMRNRFLDWVVVAVCLINLGLCRCDSLVEH